MIFNSNVCTAVSQVANVYIELHFDTRKNMSHSLNSSKPSTRPRSLSKSLSRSPSRSSSRPTSRPVSRSNSRPGTADALPVDLIPKPDRLQSHENGSYQPLDSAVEAINVYISESLMKLKDSLLFLLKSDEIKIPALHESDPNDTSVQNLRDRRIDYLGSQIIDYLSMSQKEIIEHISANLDDKYTSDRRTMTSIKDNHNKESIMFRESVEIYRRNYDISSRNRQAESERLLTEALEKVNLYFP